MNSRGTYTLQDKIPGTENIIEPGGMGVMYLKIFNLYLEMAVRDKALVYGEKAIYHFRRIGDHKILTYLLEKMAELYDFCECYDKALHYYSECENLKKAKQGLTK